MKTFRFFLLMIILLLSIGSVFAQEEGNFVRFAHLSPDAPAVDIYLNSDLTVRNLNYKGVSAYFSVESMNAEVQIVPTGETLDATAQTIMLSFPRTADASFTVAVIALDEGFELVILEIAGAASGGNLAVRGVYARATAKPMEMAEAMGAVSAAYMLIENNGDSADKLVGVTTDVAEMAQIHLTTVTDGVAQMREVEGGLEIPADGMAELKPGSYHIMLMGLKQPLLPGDVIQLTLTFESGVEIIVDVPVRAPE
jgi:periplasmic copper chaperone A